MQLPSTTTPRSYLITTACGLLLYTLGQQLGAQAVLFWVVLGNIWVWIFDDSCRRELRDVEQYNFPEYVIQYFWATILWPVGLLLILYKWCRPQ